MSTQIQPTPIVTGEKAKFIIDQITSVEASVETEKGKQILFKMFGDMEKDGFDYCIKDELGGVHTDGVGYTPDGRFCGECNKDTCAGCEVLKKTGAEFVVPEDQWLRDEDWVRCEDCIYNDDCTGREYNDGGCYSGDKGEYEFAIDVEDDANETLDR